MVCKFTFGEFVCFHDLYAFFCYVLFCFVLQLILKGRVFIFPILLPFWDWEFNAGGGGGRFSAPVHTGFEAHPASIKWVSGHSRR